MKLPQIPVIDQSLGWHPMLDKKPEVTPVKMDAPAIETPIDSCIEASLTQQISHKQAKSAAQAEKEFSGSLFPIPLSGDPTADAAAPAPVIVEKNTLKKITEYLKKFQKKSNQSQLSTDELETPELLNQTQVEPPSRKKIWQWPNTKKTVTVEKIEPVLAVTETQQEPIATLPPEIIDAPKENPMPKKSWWPSKQPKAQTKDSGKSDFAPWKNQMISGLVLTFGAPFFAIISPIKTPLVIGIFITLFFIGFFMLQKASARSRGKKVESNSIHKLKLPDGWEKRSSVMLPIGGDCDLVIDANDARRWCVEIKSNSAVEVKRGNFLFADKILIAGKKPDRDILKQTINAAECLNGRPVLWFPMAIKKPGSIKLKNGVLVVMGSTVILEKAIGARKWWAFW